VPPSVPFSALAGCLCYGSNLSLFFLISWPSHVQLEANNSSSEPEPSSAHSTSPDCDWCSVLAVLADGDGWMLRMSKAHRVER